MTVEVRVVAHADWSVRAEKRWCCAAVVEGSHVRVSTPFQVEDPAGLPGRLRREAGMAAACPVLLGVDFPLGLPAALARRLEVSSFGEFLARWQAGEWPRFHEPARTPSEISAQRPFYPRRPGGTKQHHLFDALGVEQMDDLRRRCDLRTPHRPAAASLLWVLGAQQVGRAALSGWRELLLPLRSEVQLWPFDGALDDLQHQGTTLAEAYPAEFHHHLALRLDGSKRDPAVRRAAALALQAWGSDCGWEFDDELVEQMRRGFGDGTDGEDPFDSLIGLFGTLQVAMGQRSEGTPLDDPLLDVEGWILGQQP